MSAQRFAAERQAPVPPQAAAGAVPAAPPSRTFKLLGPSRRGRCRDRVGRGLSVQAVCWAALPQAGFFAFTRRPGGAKIGGLALLMFSSIPHEFVLLDLP